MHYGRIERALELLTRAQSLMRATGELAWASFVKVRVVAAQA